MTIMAKKLAFSQFLLKALLREGPHSTVACSTARIVRASYYVIKLQVFCTAALNAFTTELLNGFSSTFSAAFSHVLSHVGVVLFSCLPRRHKLIVAALFKEVQVIRVRFERTTIRLRVGASDH